MKADKDRQEPVESLEKKEKLACPVFLVLRDGTDDRVSEVSPDPLDLKETMEKMASKEKLVYPAPKATREPRVTWDQLAVVDPEGRGVKLDQLDRQERKDHLD